MPVADVDMPVTDVDMPVTDADMPIPDADMLFLSIYAQALCLCQKSLIMPKEMRA